MKENILLPITKKIPPPKHTKVEVKCFTCRNFEICNIKKDYLKTAHLIQNIMGRPCENYEWKHIPNFCGKDINSEYFPEIVKSLTSLQGNFAAARYTDENNVKILYIFDKKYPTLFTAASDEYGAWTINNGDMLGNCNIEIQLLEENIDDIKFGLSLWREDLLEQEEAEKKKDIINTTNFTARLDCRHYDPIKGLSYKDGINRLISKYPCGIPIDDCGKLYHLATFHIEEDCVPCYHPYNGEIAYAPYPVFIPSCPPKIKKVQRREDCCGN